MSFDLGLVKSILKSNDSSVLNEILDSGINKFLVGEGKEALDFITNHYIKYGVVPDEIALKDGIGGFVLDSINKAQDQPYNYFIDKIKDRALSIHIESGLRGTIDSIKNGTPAEALAKVKELVHTAGGLRLDAGRGVDLFNETDYRINEYKRVEALGDGIDGYKTPWPTMDKVTQGFHPGDVIFYVGRLYTGKTWILLNTIKTSVPLGARVLAISMEMNPQKLGRRIDSLFGGFRYDDLRKGNLSEDGFYKYERMLKEEYKKYGELWCYGPPRVKTVADVEILVERHAPDIVFIDGVYLMGGGGVSDRYQKVLHAAEELKYMAEGKRVAVVGTIQFNKGGSQGKRLNKMDADAEDVGYSYGLAQIADGLIGLFQNADFAANKHLLINFLKVRESSKSRGFVINWDFDTMNFKEVGLWDGEQVIPTDEFGNVISEPTADNNSEVVTF